MHSYYRAACGLLLALTSMSVRATAQVPTTAPGAPSAEALATLVMQTFSSGTPEAFAAIYPDSAGRVFMRQARGKRVTQLARVAWQNSHRAVLLLGGVVQSPAGAARDANAGGDETNGARHFSGFYEAIETHGVWRISGQIPFDSANFIRSQVLQVEVNPDSGMRVVDTLGITVGARHGFAVRLNNAARIEDVRLDGKSVEHAFGGGVLWLKAPRKTRSQLVLTYTLQASGLTPAKAATDGAARTTPPFGAFHNTDVWHPFFHYLSANDFAQIKATVRIPAEYYLTTSIPQTDTVRNGVRTVYANGNHGVFLLALVYDRDWQPKTTDFGAFRFESFTGPGFRHPHDSLAALTKRVYDVLAPRFGEPQSPALQCADEQCRHLRKQRRSRTRGAHEPGLRARDRSCLDAQQHGQGSQLPARRVGHVRRGAGHQSVVQQG